MGPLPDNLVGSCQAFPSMAVEFLYPVEFWGTVNKKQTGKEWGVILVCTAPSMSIFQNHTQQTGF
jgi:hypothetical protein